MTTINSFVPPPELVDKWATESPYINPDGYIATQAAQWGADQELEACCEWLRTESKTALWQTEALRAARRPEPPSLKEQALAVLDDCADGLDGAHENVLRRALEALDD